MSAGFLETASVVFIDYGNNTPDSNGLVDNSWDIADTAIPPTLLPPLLGFNLKHGVRGCMDLSVQEAEGQLNLSSPVVTSITFSAPVPIFVVLWWGPNDFILGDANNTISVTLTSAMLTKVGACGVPGRILFEVGSDSGCTFTWSWLDNTVTVPAPALGAKRDVSQVDLSWTSPAGVTSTKLKRSLVSGGPYTTIYTGGPSVYNDFAVTNGVPYFYVATNLIGAIESANSNQVTRTPFDLTISLTSGTNPVLTITAVPNVSFYTIWTSFVPGGPYTFFANTVQTTFQFIGTLQPGVTYYMVVTAHLQETNADSQYSNEASTSSSVPLTHLSGFADIGKDQLSWVAISQASGYNIYRGTIQGGPMTLIVSGTTNTVFSDTVVTPGVTYFYSITTILNGIESAKSNVLSLTPFALTLVGTGGSLTANLSWNSVLGATLYKLKRSLTNGGPYVIINSADVTSFADSGLLGNTSYYYVVDVVTTQNGLSFESSNSNQVLVVPTQTLNFNGLVWNRPPDALVTSFSVHSLASQITSNFSNSIFQSAQIQQDGQRPADAQCLFINTGKVSFTGPNTAANLQVVLNTQTEAFVEDFTGGLFFVTITSAQHGILLHQDISQPLEFPLGTTNIPFTVPAAVGDTISVLFHSNLAFPPFPAGLEQINWQIFLTPAS